MNTIKFFICIICSLSFLPLVSQNNTAFNYQAVVRDLDDAVYPDKDIGVKFSIIHMDSEETIYEEIHHTTTSSLGHINLPLGSGTPSFGSFSSIRWTGSPLSLQISIDLNGGEDFDLVGSAPILAVPIAIHAMRADTVMNAPDLKHQIIITNCGKDTELTHGTSKIQIEDTDAQNEMINIVQIVDECVLYIEEGEKGVEHFVDLSSLKGPFLSQGNDFWTYGNDSFYIVLDPVTKSIIIGSPEGEIYLGDDEIIIGDVHADSISANKLQVQTMCVDSITFLDDTGEQEITVGGSDFTVGDTNSDTIHAKKIFTDDICVEDNFDFGTHSDGESLVNISSSGDQAFITYEGQIIGDAINVDQAIIDTVQAHKIFARDICVEDSLVVGESTLQDDKFSTTSICVDSLTFTESFTGEPYGTLTGGYSNGQYFIQIDTLKSGKVFVDNICVTNSEGETTVSVTDGEINAMSANINYLNSETLISQIVAFDTLGVNKINASSLCLINTEGETIANWNGETGALETNEIHSTDGNFDFLSGDNIVSDFIITDTIFSKLIFGDTIDMVKMFVDNICLTNSEGVTDANWNGETGALETNEIHSDYGSIDFLSADNIVSDFMTVDTIVSKIIIGDTIDVVKMFADNICLTNSEGVTDANWNGETGVLQTNDITSTEGEIGLLESQLIVVDSLDVRKIRSEFICTDSITFVDPDGNGEITVGGGDFTGGGSNEQEVNTEKVNTHTACISENWTVGPDSSDEQASCQYLANDDKTRFYCSYVLGMIKSFMIPDPKNANQKIVYASVEGPEAAAYERGVAQLINGETEVLFSDHFSSIIDKNSITVQLTPKHWDTFGIAVTEEDDKGFRVKELKGGEGNFEFNWEVKAVRKGFENYRVVRSNEDYMYFTEEELEIARKANTAERD